MRRGLHGEAVIFPYEAIHCVYRALAAQKAAWEIPKQHSKVPTEIKPVYGANTVTVSRKLNKNHERVSFVGWLDLGEGKRINGCGEAGKHVMVIRHTPGDVSRHFCCIGRGCGQLIFLATLDCVFTDECDV
jgi:hypothetical protein